MASKKAKWLDPPLNEAKVYRDMGLYCGKKGQYQRALNLLPRSQALEPEDMKIVAGLAAAELGLSMNEKVIEHVDQIMAVEPENMAVLNQKCRAILDMSDFEGALTLFYRGKILRSFPGYFTTGIAEGSEMIENTIGRNVGAVLYDMTGAISRREELRTSPPAEEAVSVFANAHKIAEEKQQRVSLERHLEARYLRRGVMDKHYLHFIASRFVGGPLRASNKVLKEYSTEAHDALCHLQEDMRMRKPLYEYKYKTIGFSENFRNKLVIEKGRRRQGADHEATGLLDKIMLARLEGDLLRVEKLSQRLREFLGNSAVLSLEQRDFFLDIMCQELALAYLDDLTLDPYLSPYQNRIRACRMLDAPLPRGSPNRATEYEPFILHTDVIRKCEEWLLESSSLLEMAWLHHALGCSYAARGRILRSRLNIRRSQTAAQQAGSSEWAIVGHLMEARTEMGQHNRQEAKASLQEASAHAHKIRAMDTLQFLEVCHDIADVAEFGESTRVPDVTERMEKLMLTEELRGELRALFQRMNASPVNFLTGQVKKRSSKAK